MIDLDYASLEHLPESSFAAAETTTTTTTHLCARGNSLEATAAALAPLLASPLLPRFQGLASLHLSYNRLSGDAPHLWRALSRLPGLTRLELGGNGLCGFGAAAAIAGAAPGDDDDARLRCCGARFARPLLPALRVLGVELNRLTSLEGLDRLAGPALEQLHARGNAALALPAAVLAPLCPSRALASRGGNVGGG